MQLINILEWRLTTLFIISMFVVDLQESKLSANPVIPRLKMC